MMAGEAEQDETLRMIETCCVAGALHLEKPSRFVLTAFMSVKVGFVDM